MQWSWVNNEYRIHRVLHTPRTAYTKYWIHWVLRHPKIDCLPLPASPSSLGISHCTQLSTYPILQVNQWIESQLPSHLPPDPPPPYSPPPSTPPMSIDHGLRVHLLTPFLTASKCITDLHHLGLQVYFQTRLITASKCISELHNHSFQIHLQTPSITASKCIS